MGVGRISEHNIGAGGIVINTSGEVILVSDNGKYWVFPKGRIEEGETLFETAEREIFEEAGISDLKLLKELGSYDRTQLMGDGIENYNIMKTIHMYLFITDQKDLNPQVEDIGEARWVKSENVIRMLQHPKDRDFFQSALDKGLLEDS